MPYQMTWVNSAVVHKRFYGALSMNDVMQSSTELHRDYRFDNLKFSINDFSEVTSVPDGVDKSALDDLAAASIGASLSKPHLKVAVVTTNRLIADMSRRYMEATAGAWAAEVFPTLDAARAWTSRA